MGVMCNDIESIEAWQLSCLEHLDALGFVTPELVIANANEEKRSFFQRLNEVSLRQIVFIAVNKILFRPRARKRVDASKILGGCDQLRCQITLEGKFSEIFSDQDVSRIRDYDLDFILRFDFGIIRGEILNSARFGVWSFHHDDETKYRGDPPCYWEIAKDDPVTGFIMQRLTDRLDGGIILKKGYVKTLAHSYRQNLSRTLFESARFAALVCIDIANDNVDYIHRPASATDAPIFRCPTIVEQVQVQTKMIVRLLQRASSAFFRHEQWTLGIVNKPIREFVDDPTHSADYLPTFGKHRFLADGFALKHGEELSVLCEDYDYGSGNGTIAWLKADSKGTVLEGPQTAFEVPSHASYPYVFIVDEQVYCIPEICQSGETAIWKCTDFPGQWEKYSTILPGVAAIDPTVLRHNGYWWMFFTRLDTDPNTNLHVWYAETIDGEWRPHALNPVKTSIRSARCGGTPFYRGQELYRPAQDCSRTYGGRIVLNRIDRLTPTQFEEEEVAVIDPDPSSKYTAGVHTIASVGELTLIDAKRNVFSARALAKELRFHAGRIFGQRR